MEIVEVVLESHRVTRHEAIVENCCNHPAALLFRGKAFDEYINPSGNNEGCAFHVVDDGVRFFCRRLRPRDDAGLEVGWIDKRNCFWKGLWTQPSTSAKVDHAAGTHRQPQIVECAGQLLHSFSKELLLGIGEKMDKRLGITWPNNASKQNVSLYHLLVVRGAAPGDTDGRFLGYAFHAMKDHVLLKYVVVAESIIA